MGGDQRAHQLDARSSDGIRARLGEDVGSSRQPVEVGGCKVRHWMPWAQGDGSQLPDGIVRQCESVHRDGEKVLANAFVVEQGVRAGRFGKGQVSSSQDGFSTVLDYQARPGHLNGQEDPWFHAVARQPGGAFHFGGVRPDRAHAHLADVSDRTVYGGRPSVLRKIDVDMDYCVGDGFTYDVGSIRRCEVASVEDESHVRWRFGRSERGGLPHHNAGRGMLTRSPSLFRLSKCQQPWAPRCRPAVRSPTMASNRGLRSWTSGPE